MVDPQVLQLIFQKQTNQEYILIAKPSASSNTSLKNSKHNVSSAPPPSNMAGRQISTLQPTPFTHYNLLNSLSPQYRFSPNDAFNQTIRPATFQSPKIFVLAHSLSPQLLFPPNVMRRPGADLKLNSLTYLHDLPDHLSPQYLFPPNEATHRNRASTVSTIIFTVANHLSPQYLFPPNEVTAPDSAKVSLSTQKLQIPFHGNLSPIYFYPPDGRGPTLGHKFQYSSYNPPFHSNLPPQYPFPAERKSPPAHPQSNTFHTIIILTLLKYSQRPPFISK